MNFSAITSLSQLRKCVIAKKNWDKLRCQAFNYSTKVNCTIFRLFQRSVIIILLASHVSFKLVTLYFSINEVLVLTCHWTVGSQMTQVRILLNICVTESKYCAASFFNALWISVGRKLLSISFRPRFRSNVIKIIL